MSLERIPAARASAAWRWLLRKLELPAEVGKRIEIVGSLRRGLEFVHDVDLLAPLPAEGSTTPDPLYESVKTFFGDPKTAAKNPLFAAVEAPERDYGRVVSGLAHGFRKLTLELELAGDRENPDLAWSTPFKLKVEIHRYVDGPKGNYGWKQMICTGPGARTEKQVGFPEMMLHKWRQRTERITGRPGRSQDGWPTWADGKREPVPDELTAFAICGVNFIPPRARTRELAAQLIHSVRIA